jgi:hypothetical protein
MATPGKRSGWAGFTVVALMLGLWLAGRVGASSVLPPPALVCPSGETVWLRGMAAPGVALLASFGEAVVGGGSAGGDGSWAIPITVRERPGLYPVTVVGRQNGELLATFTCYVDLPLVATPTPSPTMRATDTVAKAAQNDTPTLPAPPLSPISTSPQPRTTPPPSTAVPVTPAPDVTPFATATAPIEPGATIAPEPSPEASPLSPNTLVVAAVQADDPDEPGLFEYVIVENQTTAAQTLTGWQLVHRETAEVFAIPSLTIPPGELFIIWSGDGEDEADAGILYWRGASPHWLPGQTVELHAPDGQIVSTLVVPGEDNTEH